ncbi:MAG: asparaginase [Alphaproteobacteria bacterium]|nr:asparaginase [Alphaproteobacteria bacterium]
MTNPVLVELVRGNVVESTHRGAAVVCDAAGTIRAAWGAIAPPVYPRSAFKALQALSLVETGAAAAAGVTDEELALACASHSGEPMHTSRVAAWLARIGCAEADLACGPHLPYHDKSAHDLIRAGEKPCRLHNNCSGKHTGFLTLARHLGAPVAGYEQPAHPVQAHVRAAIAEMCGVAPDAMPVGIDGCAAPNYAIPLSALAQGMARLANPAGLAPERAAAAERLVSAWKAHPLLVSGTGRACADLISAARGRTVVKTGAEAVFMAALPEQGLGIALKIDDGGTRAAETVMAQLLVLLGEADPDDPRIARHRNPPLRNWRGDVVGERRTTPALGVLGALD